VRAELEVPIFKLKDLMDAEIGGFYYKEQLTKASPPDYSKDYFLIEKILQRRTINGKKYIYAKFLYYPRKISTIWSLITLCYS
jgi:hypothetical protein